MIQTLGKLEINLIKINIMLTSPQKLLKSVRGKMFEKP